MKNDWISETLYPNGVLKNKLGIKNQEELARKEYLLSAAAALRILQRHVKVKNINDLNKIHQIMFGRLYDWAGKERPGNFRKGNIEFFPHERFRFAKEDINSLLDSLSKDQPLDKEDYAKLLDRINYYHPFREGNGRSTKTFLECLASHHHQVINYPKRGNEMIASQNKGDIKGIANLLKIENTPDREAAYERILYLKKKKLRYK